MFRIYVLTTGFTCKVAALVILGLHLPTLYRFVTGRAFVNQITWHNTVFGSTLVSLVTLNWSTGSVAILADMGLLELTVVRQTHAAMILAMVSVLMFVWLKTRGAEIWMCKKSTNFHDGVKVFPRFLLYVIQEYFFFSLDHGFDWCTKTHYREQSSRHKYLHLKGPLISEWMHKIVIDFRIDPSNDWQRWWDCLVFFLVLSRICFQYHGGHFSNWIRISAGERVGCASLIFLYSSILVLHALLKATRTALTRHKLSEFLICTMDFFYRDGFVDISFFFTSSTSRIFYGPDVDMTGRVKRNVLVTI